MSIRVIKEKCRGCALCVRSCPFEAIRMSGKLPKIGAACTDCGACLEVCAFGALEKVEDGRTSGMDISEYHDVWVFAEQRDSELMPVVIELMGEGRRLADEIGCRLCTVVCGENVDRLTYELGCYGADVVYSADDPRLRTYTTDAYTKVIYEAVTEYKPEILLLGATHIGRDLGPSIAVKCGTGLTADCTKLDINAEDKKLMQTRPAFGGNLMATIVCERHRPQMATVRPGIMEKAAYDREHKCTEIVLPVSFEEEELRERVIKMVKSVREGIPHRRGRHRIRRTGTRRSGRLRTDKETGFPSRRCRRFQQSRRGCGLDSSQPSGGTDGNDSPPEYLYRLRYLRCDSASGGHAGIEVHHRHQ